MKPLAGLKILDFSQRLPGPLAGMLLSDLGADVTKIEDINYQDAFLEPKLASFDDGFVEWYGEMNAQKRLVRLDFKAPDSSQKLHELIGKADIVLHGLPDRWAQSLKLTHQDLLKFTHPLAVIELGASDNKGAMHDLNALAEAGFLNLHVAGQTQNPLPPPFLPVAGISFAQQIALKALALFRQAQQEQKPALTKLYLYEEILRVYRPFWTQNLRQQNRTKFLHNGKYPCYCLYRTKDGDWVAVAAAEEKFWREFVQLFGLNLTEIDRFSTEARVFQHVAHAIESRSTAEIVGLLQNRDICVSLIRS